MRVIIALIFVVMYFPGYSQTRDTVVIKKVKTTRLLIHIRIEKSRTKFLYKKQNKHL